MLTKNTLFSISSAHIDDFPNIQAIYQHYVENTIVSLEETAPNLQEMIARWQKIIEQSLPYLVAKMDEVIIGYAYASNYRPRTAYRFTVEESVYIAPMYHGKGIGRLLLSELIKQCQEKGYRNMLAVIAGKNHAASVHFHKKMGFTTAGILKNVAYKFDRWIDTTLMEKPL